MKFLLMLIGLSLWFWPWGNLSEAGMPKVAGKTLTTFYQNWVIYKQSVRFLVNREKMITVSDYCGDDPSPTSQGHARCEAIRVLSKVDMSKLDSRKTIGGKNPGAVLCDQYLGGKVVYGTDRFRTQKTFCQFADQSMVANDTLIIYGVNHGKK
ncbi:MAG: hypothetical protein A2X86_03125 [Bdellovibrionales bacterium GWA2_49_15]|nr:MAG: hypothetical protein A2X86_03125 [Bdellovibrionales bacterium GWA2_49_15]HAZ12206.1 hypothetical protein [Bdellovibrionales bacterium]